MYFQNNAILIGVDELTALVKSSRGTLWVDVREAKAHFFRNSRSTAPRWSGSTFEFVQLNWESLDNNEDYRIDFICR